DFYGKDNRVLFYMDRGMILHLGRQYQASNKFLDQAERAAQDLWTESIGDNAAAWLTTDNSLPYQGEDFEKVAINIVSALNYVGLNNYDGARVEARQVTNQLQQYADKYAEEDSEAVQNYRDDAFARWLSGKMRALEGSFEGHNEAWIEYRSALEIYERDYAERYGIGVPRFVVQDALHTLEALGGSFREELDSLRARFPDVEYVSPANAKEMGEVVLVHLNGEAPYKIDQFWDASANGDPLRIAYPQFVAKNHVIVGARMRASDGTQGRTEVGEPWTAIAIQNLDDHMGRIKAKAIARAIAKYLVSKGAQAAGKEAGGDAGAVLQIAGALFQAGSYIAEEADKRSWITLPAQVNIGRVYVPAGTNELDVQFVSRNGSVVETKKFQVSPQAGKTEFVFYRTYR
ncbi:MAG: hypothetical protein AAF658_11765, partial [Myxococcota bacterium]